MSYASAEPKWPACDHRALSEFTVDGETGGRADYRWEDASCRGKVVHELGIAN